MPSLAAKPGTEAGAITGWLKKERFAPPSWSLSQPS